MLQYSITQIWLLIIVLHYANLICGKLQAITLNMLHSIYLYLNCILAFLIIFILKNKLFLILIYIYIYQTTFALAGAAVTENNFPSDSDSVRTDPVGECGRCQCPGGWTPSPPDHLWSGGLKTCLIIHRLQAAWHHCEEKEETTGESCCDGCSPELNLYRSLG